MKKLIFIPILMLALLIAGCGNDVQELPPAETAAPIQGSVPTEDKESELDIYMATLEESSDAIRFSLEHEAFTQAEMNAKSAELYKLWDDALNYLWGKLKAALPEEEFSKLLDEQLIWISDKEKAVQEAGREFEGGSMSALAENSKAAGITQERVYELYDILKLAD